MCVCGYVPLLLPGELEAPPGKDVEGPGDRGEPLAAGRVVFAPQALKAVRVLFNLYVDRQLAGFDQLLAGRAPVPKADTRDCSSSRNLKRTSA